jgi:transcriptional regulator with GAF, ATPase, and Fis domain
MTEATSGASGGRDDSTQGLSADAQATSDSTDLRESLAGLSRLAASQLGLQDILTHIADFAVRAIPGADGAGLTLFQQDGPDTVVASAEFVREIDTIQYRLGEGPCITAVAEQRTVRSGSLGGDRAFPRFGPRSGRLGVHSVLSLPLTAVPEGVLGSINVYAHAKDAFDDHAVRLGELFAVPATISVQNAQALSQARRLATQLQTALTSRAIIDQALGILMSRTGCTPGEAFDKLRVISQAQNRKSSVVAQSILDEAVRRARARARPADGSEKPGRPG